MDTHVVESGDINYKYVVNDLPELENFKLNNWLTHEDQLPNNLTGLNFDIVRFVKSMKENGQFGPFQCIERAQSAVRNVLIKLHEESLSNPKVRKIAVLIFESACFVEKRSKEQYLIQGESFLERHQDIFERFEFNDYEKLSSPEKCFHDAFMTILGQENGSKVFFECKRDPSLWPEVSGGLKKCFESNPDIRIRNKNDYLCCLDLGSFEHAFRSYSASFN